MDILDPAGEYLRIFERYRRMSDEELLLLIPKRDELIPFAQEALANEVRSRGLQAEVAELEIEEEKPAAKSQPKPPSPFIRHEWKFRDAAREDSASQVSSEEAISPYEEDRKLVTLCTVWSERDALQVQRILDVASIPIFMGSEKATGVDEVTSNFAKGVEVQIMRIGLPWAWQRMQHYEPKDDPTPKEPEEPAELVVRCPQCHSEEIVFGGRTPEPGKAHDDASHKYQWTCDSCGHQWEDDGVAKEE